MALIILARRRKKNIVFKYSLVYAHTRRLFELRVCIMQPRFFANMFFLLLLLLLLLRFN